MVKKIMVCLVLIAGGFSQVQAEEPSPVVVIDDFERELKALPWSTDSMLKMSSDAKFGKQSAEFIMKANGNPMQEFTLNPDIGEQMEKTGCNTITMWVKGDSSDSYFYLGFIETEEGKKTEQIGCITRISLKDTSWHKVNLKLSEFIFGATWGEGAEGDKKLRLKGIKAYRIICDKESSERRFLIDQIQGEKVEDLFYKTIK